MAGRRFRLTAARGAAIVAIALADARASAEEPDQAPAPAAPAPPDDAAATPGEPPLADASAGAATAAKGDAEPNADAAPNGDAANGDGSANGDAGPDEVRVRGVKNGEPTAPKETLGGREIRYIPGAFGDAFRALETLPGVTPIVSGLPYYFIRGAPPGNTGFFIDGVRVPGLFHLGVGPAVMYPALIDHVDLYKGAYPVTFGRFAGGILSADTVRPGERARADWTLRLFDAGALVEAPFGREGDGAAPRGSALVSGRYGYPALLLSIFAPDAGLAYWDYQTRVSYKLSDKDQVSVFGFGSYDSISQRDETNGIPNPELSEILNIQFHRLDLRWDRRTSATGAMRAAVTLGYDRTGSQDFAARSWILGTRIVAQERLAKSAQVRGGADLHLQTYDFRLGGSGGSEVPPRPDEAGDSLSGIQKDANMAVWVDAPLVVAPRVEVTPGLRADLFTSRGIGRARAIPSLDPRVTTRIGIGPIHHLGAVGIAHQPAAFPVPIPALTFAQLRRGLQAGYHLSQGLEIPLPADITAQVSGYLHTYTGLVDLGQQCDVEDPRCDPSGARGRSVGLEAMVKRNLGKRVGGFVSYTLSRSTRDAYDVTIRKQTSRLSEFDRTHVLNVVISVDLGKGWRTGVRYTGYSGVPYSTISELLLPNARTPAFHRVDARVEKRWVQKDGRSFAITAEMFNALLMKEAVGVTCTGVPPSCSPQEIGPIAIPSLGFEGTL
ncbi:MAG: TonB-dependent receptor plug domain-containing protein [Labilithrix sp.]|nr:TonB-dependent receptor plug domain-containing protein [Labilithrix sp.]